MSLNKILNKKEIQEFEREPILNEKQKDFYFSIPKTLIKRLDDSNKVTLILMYGYFKFSNSFFQYFKNNSNIQYVSNQIEFENSNGSIHLSKSSFHRYKEVLRVHFKVQEYTNNIKSKLEKEAINLANNFVHRKKIFYSLVELSKKLNIEIPSYTELSRIITLALNRPKKEILKRLELFRDDERLKILDDFLEKDEEYDNSRYNIANFKRLEHSTLTGKMKKSIGKFKSIQSKFNMLKEIIDKLELTPKIAQYYARWIDKNDASQLKRKNDLESKFLLLSFVYYQYLIRNDNLIDRFISTVQSTKTSINRLVRDMSFEIAPKKEAISKEFEENNINNLTEILNVLNDNSFSLVNKLDSANKIVKKKIEEHNNIVLNQELVNKSKVDKYDFITDKSLSLQNKLSTIVNFIEFDKTKSNNNLITAIYYFKDNYKNLNNKVPMDFLTEEDKKEVLKDDFRVSLYKALLFISINNSIKNGTLSLIYSYRYKDFEEYLIPKDKWDKEKDLLIKNCELEHLKEYDKFIEPIKEKLENNYKKT